ncbi:hypothetical protein GLOIN_2v1829527 [Rhizophagus irregularis DAOM 181602=DAOM 197198]|uniref:Uncharacterized protein n=1 Tax=Rhizophagus irregularis (strain DAOM 181602 / DAOM 197198 / MUCL 43194) TaxID=747089 RepID=A0A2P4Q4C7_RHIID|nr:hypothetical protein GLOIN_2v1829527 [Rhizophagus irregularis DAOM 181602=DAOM 197198]POG72497.1 hypothetical protein GLOIN_2v1829527 [Rhizophagus irregularis DAOM 181602=DAOM 197198]|eukprot:XP_025179363.1 hypothetical protein GLOIN_2v1829527 [Rhizophagus irregularis DAOM 181602=DAOM 197198]
MGAGVTYVLMPLLFNAIRSFGLTAGICFVMELTCLLFSDDCPQGDWSKRNQQIEEIHGTDNESPKVHSNPSRPTIGMFFKALKNPNVGYNFNVYVRFNCSFGIELAVDNVIGYFFHDFSLSQTKAGMIGALFGLMNIFSRFLAVHFILIFLNGVFLVAFRFSLTNLKDGIIILTIFIYFTQLAAVQFLVLFPEIVGAISGLVGAGGNIGGLIFIGVFKIYANNTPIAFMVCGFVVMTVAFTV